MKELPINIFTYANHAHDRTTGKSITGFISFIGRTPIYWMAKRQGAIQTSTFGAELYDLKRLLKKQ